MNLSMRCWSKKEKKNKEKDVLKDVKCGRAYKQIQFFNENPQAFTILLYSDAVELPNPLGAAKGRQKIHQLFWTLGEIPRKQRSQVDRLQLGVIVREALLKKHGCDMIYANLMKDLKKLEGGIIVNKPVSVPTDSFFDFCTF